MNAEIKQKWIEALTSGKYKQARQRLRVDDAHCCLGVLCDLYSKATGLGCWQTLAPDGPADYEFRAGESVALSYQPPEVSKWLETAEFDDNKILDLALLNDKGTSFEEIAKLIEAM